MTISREWLPFDDSIVLLHKFSCVVEGNLSDVTEIDNSRRNIYRLLFPFLFYILKMLWVKEPSMRFLQDLTIICEVELDISAKLQAFFYKDYGKMIPHERYWWEKLAAQTKFARNRSVLKVWSLAIDKTWLAIWSVQE